MPNLEEFNAGTGKLEVNDRGAESFAQAGRRAGVAFDQLGREASQIAETANKHQVDMDNANTYTASSTAQVNGLKNLQDWVNQPDAADHPELGQALIQQYTQAQNDIASHASTPEGKVLGQRLARERIEQFTDRVTSEMAVLAGNKNVQNFETHAANGKSIVTDDPSQLANQLAEIDHFYASSIPHNMSIEGVSEIEKLKPKLKAELAMTAFVSAAQHGEQDIANGGQGKQLDAARAMLRSGIADDLPGFNKPEVEARLDDAVTRGLARNEQRLRYGNDALKTQGMDAYAQVDAALEPYLYNGKVPPPDLGEKISQITTAYGKVIPGETHDLNALWAKINDPTRDFETQGGDVGKASAMEQRILTGDRTADLVALNKGLQAGDFSIAQYKVMRGLLPPKGTEIAPAMKQAMEQLNQRETAMISSLPQGMSRGTVAAILRHDMTETFEGWAGSEGDPAKALDIMTNANNPHNFLQLMATYRQAVNQPDPIAFLKQKLHGLASAGYGAAEGSTASPLTGPTAAGPQAAPATGPLSADRAAQLAKWAGGH